MAGRCRESSLHPEWLCRRASDSRRQRAGSRESGWERPCATRTGALGPHCNCGERKAKNPEDYHAN
eukprot:scaffold94057_cov30-Tisochrysis_lutea.AAC.1